MKQYGYIYLYQPQKGPSAIALLASKSNVKVVKKAGLLLKNSLIYLAESVFLGLELIGICFLIPLKFLTRLTTRIKNHAQTVKIPSVPIPQTISQPLITFDRFSSNAKISLGTLSKIVENTAKVIISALHNLGSVLLHAVKLSQPVFSTASAVTSSSRKHAYAWLETGNNRRNMALGLFAFTLGGLLAFYSPIIKMESGYIIWSTQQAVNKRIKAVTSVFTRPLFTFAATKTDVKATPSPSPLYNPLKTPDGTAIVPVNTEFAIVVPKVGINATILQNIDPGSKTSYTKALREGVAHSKTSVLPDQVGTVYLFSHSTNFEWFVKDLNAIFYLLKNLDVGDEIVVVYKGRVYIYRMRETKIVAPNEVSYLVPQRETKSLILQTCWPPGTVTKRKLFFAELVDEQDYQAILASN